ncbi:MAG: ATP-binding domain-containing protein, partial [candidate division Zixibacteria bacterium]|nr:ATP-binding domain-containing protein [candidate division Zixibacteria bacterium]
ELPKLFLTDSAIDEASTVVAEIEKNLPQCLLKETVILYRTNAQSRAFEEILRRKNIPYQIIGGISFYQRKEIRDLVAYLKFLANPKDDISFQRIINYPKRGLGENTLDKLMAMTIDSEKSLYEICHDDVKDADLGSRAEKSIQKFTEQIDQLMQKKGGLDIAALTQELVDQFHLTEALIEEDPITGENRVENIEEFIGAAHEFAADNAEPTLENFLTEISLYTDMDEYREIEDKLTLMTLHAAKGLEFHSVYMVGLEDGLFPLGRAIENPMELEEERRLFYVGATRAKRNLYISMAAMRNRFGMTDSIPSRFLKELPPALIEVLDLRRFRHHESEVSSSIQAVRKREQSQPKEVHYEYEEEELLRVGRIVQHPAFGRGKVVKAEGSGEGLRLEIYFAGVGVKRILAKYAKLKIVG